MSKAKSPTIRRVASRLFHAIASMELVSLETPICSPIGPTLIQCWPITAMNFSRCKRHSSSRLWTHSWLEKLTIGSQWTQVQMASLNNWSLLQSMGKWDLHCLRAMKDAAAWWEWIAHPLCRRISLPMRNWDSICYRQCSSHACSLCQTSSSVWTQLASDHLN